MTSNSGSAVQIVTIQSGKVRIMLDVLLPILEKVGSHPLAIVSVNGPMRTGKSYLLGHFLRYLGAQGRSNWMNVKLIKEFDWKSSADRQTIGILVWSEPFFLNKDGRQIGVLLMDTQGSFDDDTDYSINYMLFTMSYMLSTTFIYNVKYQISEDVLEVLQLFLGFARLKVEEGFDEPIANLVMVIRDWQNPKDYAYGYHDKSKPKEKNFLKDKLEVRSHMAEDVKEAHAEVIKSFQSVACCLLPYPGQGLSTVGTIDNLDESFTTALEEFVPRVCTADNIVIKVQGGHVITGFAMAEMIKQRDKLFVKVAFDDIKSYTNMAAEKQNYTAVSLALQAYKKQMDAMKSRNGCTAQELEVLHDKAKKEAIMIFKKQRRIRYPSIEEQFNKNLGTQIQTLYASYREMNETHIKLTDLKKESDEVMKCKAAMKDMERKMEQNAKIEMLELNKLENRHKEQMNEQLLTVYEMMRRHDEEMRRHNEEMRRHNEEMMIRDEEMTKLKLDMNKLKLEMNTKIERETDRLKQAINEKFNYVDEIHNQFAKVLEEMQEIRRSLQELSQKTKKSKKRNRQTNCCL